MAKKILGLDLGTTSIGWAFVEEDENPEYSKIIKLGTRIIQYDNYSKVDKTGKVSESKDPEGDFNAGRGLSPNADRTSKRGARRNLNRYQLRRKNLFEILIKNNIIDKKFNNIESSDNSTYKSFEIRSKAAYEKVSLNEFARVLFMINKKRGYKSSRKAKSEDEGMAIDGMAIAKELYDHALTPGQYVFQLLKAGKKFIPDFYRSDLQNELEKIWLFQKQFYPEILTDDFKKQIEGKGKVDTQKMFLGKFQIYTAENKASNKKLQSYEWRSKALHTKIEDQILAYVIVEINNDLNKSSGYLGAISDRSKELYFNKLTVGQYQFNLLKKSNHTSLKNQIFYRQDYLDEFEKVWATQAQFHSILNEELKKEVRDVIIFYQRKLKSQKHLISKCEFEKFHKVIPRSHQLFQQFKIWQILNNFEFVQIKSGEKKYLDIEAKNILFEELNIKGKMSKKQVIEFLGYKDKDYDLNYKEVEGNNSNQKLYEAFRHILDREGQILDLENTANEVFKNTKILLEHVGIDSGILDFNDAIEGDEFDKQKSIQFWHLLYSLEEDKDIIRILQSRYGFKEDQAKIIANIALQPDYGNLSARAIRKIMPFLKAGNKYSEACALAGYNHSNSKTSDQRLNDVLAEKIEILPKNSLRNPVVEKILNQMIHIVNAIIQDSQLGRPDEVRIELARELKKSAKEREEMSANISSAKKENERIYKIVQMPPFGIKNPTRNDIIRYKLYQELESNGFKTLYSNTYIPAEELYSKNFDIEHIIPKVKLFDDSFSNKTLEQRDINIRKGDNTAVDFMQKYNSDRIEEYKKLIESLYKNKNISKAKFKKLLMKECDIPSDFIDRDIRDTQYISRKATELLQKVVRTITPTSGNITDRLREDWGLINVMQELNFEKHKTLGLTEMVEKKDGSTQERIIEWSKRNDHRHHAMDALTVAFTKPAFIQYLNNLNAKNEDSDKGKIIYAIENKYLEKKTSSDGYKRIFKMPILQFREQAKLHLESILISFKTKNKVITRNKNKIKLKGKDKFVEKIQLTPRGQLHNETVYGSIKLPIIIEVKVDGKLTLEKIQLVINSDIKDALKRRLLEHGNDPKKAFTGKNSPDKIPIYVDEAKKQFIPAKIKLLTYEQIFTIRKKVDKELKIDKVIDQGVKRILELRLKEYDNDPKIAFADLDKNPIWLNREKGIAIKRVTITGVSNVEALHSKKNHLGENILDEHGNTQPVNFVSTGNNHHVAIYRDAEGKLQEDVVSFYEAVARANAGLPVIKKQHEKGWEFLFTMKQNECFVFPDATFNPQAIDLMDPRNAKIISKRLFRVQKIASKDYTFRHHFESTLQNNNSLANITFIRLSSLQLLNQVIKLRLNHIGKVVQIGEY